MLICDFFIQYLQKDRTFHKWKHIDEWTNFVLYVRYIMLSSRYSVLVGILVVFIWQISEFWSSSYSSNIVNSIITKSCSHKVEYLTIYWKELFVEKQYFCKLNFLFVNVEYLYCQFDEALKKNFFIVYRAYIYLFFFIILFSKSKTTTTKKSYLIKNEVFEENQTFEIKSIYYKFPVMFKHITIEIGSTLLKLSWIMECLWISIVSVSQEFWNYFFNTSSFQ